MATPQPPPAGAPDYDFLWEEYQEEMRRAAEYEQEGEDVFPEPAFVLKVRAEEIDGRPQKVFVNVCSSPQIGPPQVQPGAAEDGGDRLRVPVSCGPPRADADKEGRPSTVFDVIFNDEAVARARQDREFRDVLAGFAVENLERKHGFQTDRKYKFPKLRYKAGGMERPPPHRIRRQPKAPPAKEAVPADAAAPVAAAAPEPVKRMVQVIPGPGSPAPSSVASPRSPRSPRAKKRRAHYDWSFSFTTPDGAKRVPLEDLRGGEVPVKMQCLLSLPDITSVSQLDINTSSSDLVVRPLDKRNPGSKVVLPFLCDEDATTAKFSKSKRRLTVTFVPVKANPGWARFLRRKAREEAADAAEKEAEAAAQSSAAPPPAAPASSKAAQQEGAPRPPQGPKEAAAAADDDPPAPVRPEGGAARLQFENTIMYELCA